MCTQSEKNHHTQAERKLLETGKISSKKFEDWTFRSGALDL